MINDTHTQATANETTAPTEIEQFIESLAMNHVDAMEGLFAAIAKLSEPYSTIKKLATHGVYLAQSLHNDLDCQRGDMKAARIQAATKPARDEPLPPNVTPLH